MRRITLPTSPATAVSALILCGRALLAQAPPPATADDSAPPASHAAATPFVVVAVQYASDGEREGFFAVPVACVDAAGSFAPEPEMCAEALGSGPVLYAGDTPVEASGGLVGIPDRDGRAFPLDAEPAARLLTSAGGPARSATCRHESEPSTVGPMAPDPLARLEGGGADATALAATLAGEWVATASLVGDLDGDGQHDRLLAARLPRDEQGGPRCSVVVAMWGDARSGPTLVDASCEGRDDWALSDRYGPFNLEDSSCWDFNRDGRVELWLSTGGDSQRHYELVEVRGGRFERAGGSIWLGD